MLKIIEKLLYTEDDPNSGYNRRWRWWLDFDYWNDTFCLSLEQQLVQFNGIPDKPPYNVPRCLTIGLRWNPFKWECASFHTYYDGNWCAYNYGPIHVSMHDWRDNCKKCNGENA